MICNNLSTMFGLSCYPLTEDGSIAMVETPFKFADGDYISVFVQQLGDHIRFFDDGLIYLHFASKGLFLDNKKISFLSKIAKNNNISFSDESLNFELLTKTADSHNGFAQFISTYTDLITWEKEKSTENQNGVSFIDEVIIQLKLWKPNATFIKKPSYKGVSGKSVEFDYSLDGTAILAIEPHSVAVGGALRKLVDVGSSIINEKPDTLVVLDDRKNTKTAREEANILTAVSTVMDYSKLLLKTNTINQSNTIN